MSDNRQTVENGAGRPRNGRRENVRAACAEAVQLPSGAHLVPCGGKREFPM